LVEAVGMSRKIVVERRRLLVDDFFKLEEAFVSFEKRDGTMSQAVRRLDLKRDDAVCAVVVNRAKAAVILVRQFRYAGLARSEAWPVELVAGLIDEGETPEQAIAREILEEAGYAVGAPQRIFTFYPSPGITSERGLLYYAETSGAEPVAKGGGLAAENEDIEVLERPFAEAFAMLDRGEIVDGKTILGLMWLREKLRNG
jgi:nudix-type nucleoside diphosphatase (YffH/AdpP family)